MAWWVVGGGVCSGVWWHAVAWCGIECGSVVQCMACGHPTCCVALWCDVQCGAAGGFQLVDVSCHVVAWCVVVQCSAQCAATHRWPRDVLKEEKRGGGE